MFDVTRRETFLAVQRILSDLRQSAEPDCVVYLVGNKIDLLENNENKRAVSLEEAKIYASENRLCYIETSALSNYKVTEAFESLLEGILYNFICLAVNKERQKNVSYKPSEGLVDIRKKNDRPTASKDGAGGCCN